MLKTSFDKQIVLILNCINSEIIKWLEHTFYFSQEEKLNYKLDVYVYKLFWRHLKKRHSKKSNTWIYLKYWGNFSGLWKFFIFDYRIKRFIFLKSHVSLPSNSKTSNYKIYDSLNIFNSYNVIKLSQIIFKKFEFRYLPNYAVLYEKQKGLCFVCMKSLYLKNYKILYLKSNNNKFLENLVLIHLYCDFTTYFILFRNLLFNYF